MSMTNSILLMIIRKNVLDRDQVKKDNILVEVYLINIGFHTLRRMMTMETKGLFINELVTTSFSRSTG